MINLLIADDESIVRRGIKTLVDYASLGIGEVFEAENGEAALALVKQGNIHIVFADINMPKMNGLEFVRKAKRFDPTLRIALITGYDYFDYAQAALKASVDDYVLKPVSKDDVTELLIKLCERCKAAQGVEAMRQSAGRLAGLATLPEEDGLKKLLLEEVNQNIASSTFSLGELAEHAGYSTAYLSTLFKKCFGTNFRDYLLDLRLERAKILLLSTPMKGYEIAQAIGMEDANYFSACFKRKFGLSTTEFRKQRGQL